MRVKIESPVAKDLFSLRDQVIEYLGGKVIKLNPPASEIPSLVRIIKGDVMRAGKYVAALYGSILRKLGSIGFALDH